jgi:hypothetical protein
MHLLVHNQENGKRDLTNHIESWFGKIAVQLCQTIGEFRYIDGDQLVWVLYPIIECRDPIKCQFRQVFIVYMLC